MIGIVVGLIGGLALSALFSGAETGFYRIPRLRLVLDAVQGDRIAKGLLWFTRHPTFFVATVLTGNNLANFTISASIVALVYSFLSEPNEPLAMLISTLATPLIFVYAELLPKTLFLHRPDRLLRPVSPVFFAFGLVFLPLTFPLWLLGRLLSWLTQEGADRWEATLARRELKRILGEAKAAGVLRPVQYRLAESIFELGSWPVSRVCSGPEKLPVVDPGAGWADALRAIAQGHRPEALVWRAGTSAPAGYVRVIDLLMLGDKALASPRSLVRLPVTYSALEALLHLIQADEPLALVEGDQHRIVGFLQRRQVVASLLGLTATPCLDYVNPPKLGGKDNLPKASVG